jgi:hypothetical protein
MMWSNIPEGFHQLMLKLIGVIFSITGKEYEKLHSLFAEH